MAEGGVIHRLAVVEAGASLGKGVKIGPFCHIGADVTLGDDVELVSHVAIAGRTHIGARTKIFPFASLGHDPQDKKYRGEASSLIVGADCLVREGATLNPGTASGGMKTVVGDHCLIMAGAHVAHDCILGAHVVLTNHVMLAGHVRIDDHAILGGGAAVIQHARIGRHAYVAGMSGLEGDLPPFGLASGNRARLRGLNVTGLRRNAFSKEAIANLRNAYRLLFAGEGDMNERTSAVLTSFPNNPDISELLAFLGARGNRPLCRPKLLTHDSGD